MAEGIYKIKFNAETQNFVQGVTKLNKSVEEMADIFEKMSDSSEESISSTGKLLNTFLTDLSKAYKKMDEMSNGMDMSDIVAEIETLKDSFSIMYSESEDMIKSFADIKPKFDWSHLQEDINKSLNEDSEEEFSIKVEPDIENFEGSLEENLDEDGVPFIDIPVEPKIDESTKEQVKNDAESLKQEIVDAFGNKGDSSDYVGVFNGFKDAFVDLELVNGELVKSDSLTAKLAHTIQKQADDEERFKNEQDKARAAAEKLKEALTKVGSAIASAVKDAAKFAGHLAVAGSKGILNTLTFGLFKARKEATLLSKALQLAGVAGIGALFKQASSAANDLTDSVSLVNSTFGENAAGLHKWADETALYFNMSRLEAEKYFGKLGEYMRSTGLGTDASALMAKNLTAKAGEMSRAFAGMTSEEATEQLYKVLSSERPKSAGAKIGLNLSNDALEAELLAEGIDRTYKSLSDAEKVVIKYNAAMRQLSNITGSTADGFDSWEGAVANLTANVKDALSSLGLIIQHYLLPVVQLLNQVMSAIAQSLRGLLGTLGIELPTAATNAADSFDDMGDSAEGAGNKASKSLLPIDKLTVLSDSKGSSGGGKSNAGEDLEGLIKPLDWLKDGMKKPMKSIQELLNILKKADWSKAGKKVAEVFNAIVKKVKEFVDKLGQFNLGEKLGEFVNGFIKDFDANALGDLLGTLFGNAQDTITEFLTTFKAEEFGQKLADLIIGFDLEENLGKIGTNFGLLVTEMGGVINGMLGGEKGKEVKESIKEGIKNMLSNAIENIKAETLGDAIGNLASTIGYALTGAAEGIDGLGTKLADVLNEAIENGGIEDLAKGIADFVVAAAGEVGKFITSTDWLELVKSIISGIKEALDNAPEEDKNALFGVIAAWFGVKTLGTFLKNKLLGKEGTELGTSVGTALINGIKNALASPAGTLASALAVLGSTIFGLVKGTIHLSDYIGAVFDEDIAVDSLNSKIENYAGGLAWSRLAPDEDTLSINAATIDKAEESINLYKDRIKAAFADFEGDIGNWYDYGSDESVARLKADAENIRLQLVGIKETGMVIPGLDDTIAKLGEIVNYDPDSEVGGTNKLATMFDDAMGNVVEYTRDLDTFQGKIKEFSENTPEYYQKIVDAGANFKIEEETKKIADNLQSWAEADVKEPFDGVKATAKQIYDYSAATGTVFKDYGEMEKVAMGLADGSLQIPEKVDAITESEGKLSDKIDDEVVPSLTHFLESSDKVLNLTWNGDLIDNDALQANLDIAVNKVKTAVKDIEDAINETANLRNFVAVLDSTQTIKVDQSGTMNFKFDVTTKPDKDAFNTWQEKYTYSNKKTVG